GNEGGQVLGVVGKRLIEWVGRKWEDVGPKQERLEIAEKQGIAADCHGAEGVAVVSMLEADEIGSPRLAVMAPELVGHLEGDLDGGTAVVRIEDAPFVPGHCGQ